LWLIVVVVESVPFSYAPGVGEGVSFPSIYTLYGDWLPKSEKTILYVFKRLLSSFFIIFI
jgi:hypothetical protein